MRPLRALLRHRPIAPRPHRLRGASRIARRRRIPRRMVREPQDRTPQPIGRPLVGVMGIPCEGAIGSKADPSGWYRASDSAQSLRRSDPAPFRLQCVCLGQINPCPSWAKFDDRRGHSSIQETRRSSDQRVLTNPSIRTARIKPPYEPSHEAWSSSPAAPARSPWPALNAVRHSLGRPSDSRPEGRSARSMPLGSAHWRSGAA